jgi:chemotaxis protein CheD
VREVRVNVADVVGASGEATLATIGLGSCVAIALHDAAARVGALAHVLLPSETMAHDRSNHAKFPSTAVPAMIERMKALGAREGRITARIAGGASMFASLVANGALQMGERNVVATRQALEHAGIRLVASDVGGGHGRSVYFNVSSGVLQIRSMAKGHVEL